MEQDYRELFLWSALKMLAETGRHKVQTKTVGVGTQKILLLEEPEAFLHPSAIRSAMDSLYAIAEHTDWQIMITSHSPNFINLTKDHTTIIRIEKNEATQHEVHTFSTDEVGFTVDDKENLKMLNFCNPYFNEFFFSSNIFLVEGETEVTVVKSLMQIGEVAKDCIHIINCLGKANIVTISKILNHFKMNYSILHDSDSPKAKRDGKHIVNSMWTTNRKINEEVELGRKKGLNIKTFVSVPNFEGEYFDGKTGSSKPFGAWKMFTGEENPAVKKFAQILYRITGRQSECAVEYQNTDELFLRVQAYIANKGLNGDLLWQLEEDEEAISI